MELRVNPAACDGFGFCADILGELISLDEWGFPVAVPGPVPEPMLGAAKAAAKACPRRALELTG